MTDSSPPKPVVKPADTVGGSDMWTGYLLAGIGATLFSTKAILIKLAYGHTAADAETIIALRMAFALPIYIVIGMFAFRARRTANAPAIDRRHIYQAAAVGLLGYWIASYLDFEGLSFITAQFERLILFTYPFFVMILGALFFGGRITRWGVGSILVAYAGLAIIFTKGLQDTGDAVIVGGLLVLAAAFCFSLYQLLAKQIMSHMTSAVFTCVAMSSAGIATLVHYLVVHGLDFSRIDTIVLIICAAIALLATVLPSFMLNSALGRIGPEATAMTGTLSPLGTIILAVLILGEQFTVYDAAGTALVLLGVGYYSMKDVKRRRPADQPT